MNSGLLINMTMSFLVMLGHSSLSGLLINMTMSFVVMLGHVSLSGLLINMTMSFVVMLSHSSLSGLLATWCYKCCFFFGALLHWNLPVSLREDDFAEITPFSDQREQNVLDLA